MRKHFAYGISVVALLGVIVVAFGQPPIPTESPTVTPTPTSPPVLVSTATPTPTPTPVPSPTITPNDTGTVSVPSTLGASPSISPSPSATPIGVQATALGESDLGWSEKGAPIFRLDQAVITALAQNPVVLQGLEEIRRTKGVVIEIRAQALPQIGPTSTWGWTDPNLRENSTGFTTFSGSGGSGGGGGGGTTGFGGIKNLRSDISYNIKVTGTQLVFNYSTLRAIRGTFFQRDSAYFALRNTVDQTIANVKTQFYQVIVNRELIVVQEESVNLLQSQLKDQQNRFEAGTVPRFNVLQAQVQLYNQIPQLIAARNAYRISVLQLAKTLGLDFNPARGNAAPLRAVGDIAYIPRNIDLLAAIEAGKRNRPFLKQQRANVLNAIEQVHVAIGGWLPNINANGGGEWLSNQFSSSFGDVSKGWLTTMTGSWPIWDSGIAWGKIQEQRAILSQQEITYDDDVRQVELEIQQSASNLAQNRELIQATEKNQETAEEAVRLAKARLDAGAGTQLDVLNAQVQLTTAQSTYLQALFGYDSSLAEFDRVTGTQSSYAERFDGIAPRATRSRTYYTGSDVDARGKPKRTNPFEPGPVTTTTTTISERPSSK
ncbi:MAG TPA: TolC family protein [Chthoniobacterales bacterium]|nr:TolC family protein [Chthoniobacterales bacterium]